MSQQGLISVNYHLLRACNYRCRFCFATFADVSGALSLPRQIELLRALRGAGCEKLNFAGGEPTLYRHLPELLREARELGFVTSIITNGARLEALLATSADDLDWVGLSIDSADEAIQARLGRGEGHHVARSRELASMVHSLGLRLKVNTVITSLNWEEDLRPLIRDLHPERWKVFQVLPVGGQNDGLVEPLLISREHFQVFIDRNELPPPLHAIVEDNEAMAGSYAMIDPLGRFFSNVGGHHTYSRPILDIGVATALEESRFSPERLIRRGGRYAW
jgi:radical S-adenosyl methionine domain-containing protein 2